MLEYGSYKSVVLLEALAAIEPLKHDECWRDREPVAGDVFESLISERNLSLELILYTEVAVF